MQDFSISTTLKILQMSKIFHKITDSKLKSFISLSAFHMNSGNVITLVSSIYSRQDDLYGNIYGFGTTLKVFTEPSSNKRDGLR